MTKETESIPAVRRESASILTPELVDAQGRNDREFLTHRVRLLLDAKEKYPSVPFEDLSHLVNLAACGQGCCCCCGTLILPGSDVMIPNR